MILYHGGTDIIEKPEIRCRSGGSDFGMGFYCTDIRSQAEKWAKRQGFIRKQNSVLNLYEFDYNKALNNLRFKKFEDYSNEWLELVINCRKNPGYVHGFALQKLAFLPSNNQYCFSTEKSLSYILFLETVNLG